MSDIASLLFSFILFEGEVESDVENELRGKGERGGGSAMSWRWANGS